MKRILLLFATGGVLLGTAQSVLAHGGSAVQLTITPKLCVVDVIQDGSNQTLQTSSPDCEVALPNLITVPGRQARGPLFALPFAGSTQEVPLLRPRVEDSWLPIVSKEQGSPTTYTSTRISRVMTGLAVASIASAIGIDLALFDLHYSRSTLRWLHRWSVGQVIKK